MKLINKHIVVAVSGSIAAYKSAELVRALQRQGAQVRVAMTESATRFVTPLTFQALSGHPVHIDDDASLDPAGMDHIALARWSDAIVLAPATANIIAKLAHGIADDFISSMCLAQQSKLAIAPAMNQAMWSNAATQENITTFEQRDIAIFGPASGLQACGETGHGRMLEVDQLVLNCINLFANDLLNNKHVVITAGPTIEPIDPVRFISNRSSGKMGYSLAEAALEAGANVTVISGPTHIARNEHIKYTDVQTAEQMLLAAHQHASDADLFIAAAAVADYAPAQYAAQKIKKHDDQLSLALTRTNDILKEIKKNYPSLYCVGFAAETDHVVKHAKQKLINKSLNMIIANQVGLEDQGFDSDYNAVEIITEHDVKTLARARKTQLAPLIIKHIASHLSQQNKKSNVSYL